MTLDANSPSFEEFHHHLALETKFLGQCVDSHAQLGASRFCGPDESDPSCLKVSTPPRSRHFP